MNRRRWKIGLAFLCAIGMLCGCGKKEAEPPKAENSEMANPMVKYETVSELEEALGFPCLSLAGPGEYELDTCHAINKEIGQLHYVDKKDSRKTFLVRTAKGSGNISGYYGGEYTEKEINDIMVTIGANQEDCIAYWTEGEFAYSATSSNLDEEAFAGYIEAML